VTAAYVADAFYHQNCSEIRNPYNFFRLVTQPFWNVQKGRKVQYWAVCKQMKLFRYNLITLLQKLVFTHVYHVDFNNEDKTCLLHLCDGCIVLEESWQCINQHISAGVKPEKAGDIAAKEKAKRDAKKAANKAKEMALHAERKSNRAATRGARGKQAGADEKIQFW
jgi:hypothetical protein